MRTINPKNIPVNLLLDTYKQAISHEVHVPEKLAILKKSFLNIKNKAKTTGDFATKRIFLANFFGRN